MSDAPIWPPRRPDQGGPQHPVYPTGNGLGPGSWPSAAPGSQPSAQQPIPQPSAPSAAVQPPLSTAGPTAATEHPAPATEGATSVRRRRFSPGVLVALILAIAAIAVAIVLALTMPRNSPAPVVTVYAPDTAQAPTPATSAAAPDPTATTASASATASPSATSATASPSASATTDDQALKQLQGLRDSDIGSVQTNSQWVAMLSSKWVGVNDPQQTTESGGHTFGAVDILHEHMALRSGNNLGARVALIYGTDYGTQVTHDGATMYVTIALGSFDTRDDVNSWCKRRFPDKSGQDLLDTCMPVQLAPKQ